MIAKAREIFSGSAPKIFRGLAALSDGIHEGVARGGPRDDASQIHDCGDVNGVEHAVHWGGNEAVIPDESGHHGDEHPRQGKGYSRRYARPIESRATATVSARALSHMLPTKNGTIPISAMRRYLVHTGARCMRLLPARYCPKSFIRAPLLPRIAGSPCPVRRPPSRVRLPARPPCPSPLQVPNRAWKR